ncbi:exported protein of unknown function [Ruminococcaceae bacterium BL-4]|nr:exported protein of unknown function [Ruminococcaceae bacterium BL-4]
MKKFFALLLAAIMCFALAGCGESGTASSTKVSSTTSKVLTSSKSSVSSSTSNSTIPKTSVSSKASSNPLMNYNFVTQDERSGSGKTIGKYGYISASKELTKNATQDQFKEFINAHVKDSGLNYVSIIFEDGTGICFTGSNTEIIDYGNLNKDGSLKESIGTITLSNGNYIYKAN